MCISFDFYYLLLVISTARHSSKKHYGIVGFFNLIEGFITRLELYTKIPLTPEMTEMVSEIMAEILSGLVLLNKQTIQGRFSKFILPTILMC